MGGFGIGVTLMEPGAFDTGFTSQVVDAAQNPASPYAALCAVEEGFEREGQAPTGSP